jgi:SRSO17 transposase
MALLSSPPSDRQTANHRSLCTPHSLNAHSLDRGGSASTLPANIEFAALVDVAKLRWRVERDYQEHKQEVGLGHFERRGWCGFQHKATMCVAIY